MEVKEPAPKCITKQMMTAEEYLEREPKQPEKHEYHGGEIVDMSGASLPQNYIQANLFGEFYILFLKVSPAMFLPATFV